MAFLQNENADIGLWILKIWKMLNVNSSSKKMGK